MTTPTLPFRPHAALLGRLQGCVYATIAATSFVLAACQPAEGPAERAGKAVDNAAATASDKTAEAGKSIGHAASTAVDKTKNAVSGSK